MGLWNLWNNNLACDLHLQKHKDRRKFRKNTTKEQYAKEDHCLQAWNMNCIQVWPNLYKTKHNISAGSADIYREMIVGGAVAWRDVYAVLTLCSTEPKWNFTPFSQPVIHLEHSCFASKFQFFSVRIFSNVQKNIVCNWATFLWLPTLLPGLNVVQEMSAPGHHISS